MNIIILDVDIKAARTSSIVKKTPVGFLLGLIFCHKATHNKLIGVKGIRVIIIII